MLALRWIAGADRAGEAAVNIESWLEDLGLQRYAQTFRDQEVDLDILGDPTEADLKQLGVPLGHRKKLLKAIARLAEPATASPPRCRAPRPSGAS